MKIIEMIDGNRNINFYKLRTGVELTFFGGLTDLFRVAYLNGLRKAIESEGTKGELFSTSCEPRVHDGQRVKRQFPLKKGGCRGLFPFVKGESFI